MLVVRCGAASTVAADFSGRVVGVSDGDTLTILHSDKAERIRLNEIESPERRQTFGKRAKQFTSNLVFAKTVTGQALDQDRYGRTDSSTKAAFSHMLEMASSSRATRSLASRGSAMIVSMP